MKIISVLSLILSFHLFATEKQYFPKIAVLFVGHGEPANLNEWKESHTLWDGSVFGPMGITLNVPENEQNSIFAAAYEEVATAITYQIKDFNKNGTPYELFPFPKGDVPPFFTFEAFKGKIMEQYAVLGESPHTMIMQEHMQNVSLGKAEPLVDIFTAFLDSKPFISTAIDKIKKRGPYQKLIVIKLFMASDSTHTQEINDLVMEWIHKAEIHEEIIWADTLFDDDYTRSLQVKAVLESIEVLKERIPTNTKNEDVGVVLVGHGSPYQLPLRIFGHRPGDIHSNLNVVESRFTSMVLNSLPYDGIIGVNEFHPPKLEDAIKVMEKRGKKHILVIPTIFSSASFHTMWDAATKAVGRPVKMEEKFGKLEKENTTIWYTPLGYADTPKGKGLFRESLTFSIHKSLLEVAFKDPKLSWITLLLGK